MTLVISKVIANEIETWCIFTKYWCSGFFISFRKHLYIIHITSKLCSSV